MAENGLDRKLRAILSADVKGYSRLMGEDEEHTIKTITAYRETFFSLISKHKGRVVDSPGDNILAEFASALNAVNSAIEIQETLKEKNADLPDNRKMEFRIGINLGDIVQEGDRIYGDGVNVAARIEGLADPGGVCISRNVCDQVKKKLTNLGYEYIGAHDVKNISEPVRVYKVLAEPEYAGKVIGEETPKPAWPRTATAALVTLGILACVLVVWNLYTRRPTIEAASVEKMAFPLPDKPSIAVLPFANISGDPEQEFISNGIAEQIIIALSKISSLFVIAPESTFTYKNKSLKKKQVSEDLGVRYVLEGTVQKSGNKTRVTAQLVDSINGQYLWAERYDRNLQDIFTLQDEITTKILVALQVKLTRGESARVYGRNTDNLEAYLKYLQAVHHKSRTNQEGNILARKLCKEAIVLDPNYGDAYGLLAFTHLMDIWFGWSKSKSQSFKQAEELAKKCLSIDNNNALSAGLVGHIYLLKRQYDKAIAEGERAIALSPNSPYGYMLLAATYRFSGSAKKGIPLLEKAIRLQPYAPSTYLYQLGMAYNFTGQYDEAIDVLKKSLKRTPDHLLSLLGLTIAYSLADRMEEARATADSLLKVNPKFSVVHMEKRAPYKHKSDLEFSMGALHKAGLK